MIVNTHTCTQIFTKGEFKVTHVQNANWCVYVIFTHAYLLRGMLHICGYLEAVVSLRTEKKNLHFTFDGISDLMKYENL